MRIDDVVADVKRALDRAELGFDLYRFLGS